MPGLEKNSRIRKASLLGLSILIHLILIFVLSVSNISKKEDVKKKELRVIKVARVIKAKDKKDTKTRKPKPKKKTVKKKKTTKKAQKASVKKPRLAKAKKVKTTRMKKAKTKVEKAKLKVAKKLRLQEEKQTTQKNLQKAPIKPTQRKLEQKKVEEYKSKTVTKVVQQKKIVPKIEKNLTIRKVTPKQLVTKTKFKQTQKQKVQKLKRHVQKIEQKKTIFKPKTNPNLDPTKKVVKKEIHEKKIVPDKTPIKPVHKTFKLAKKLPKKIEQKVPKRKIQEARKNVKIKKVTPTKTSEFRAQDVKRQKIQKLNRVRKPVKTVRRVITKPRLAPKINQPQKVVRKQVVKEELKQTVKDFEPVRKKITTQIKKKITPKIVEQVQVPRKLESLLAVEKTKSTPTMTTVKVEDIVEDKPKMVQEVAQASRRESVKPVRRAITKPLMTPELNQPKKVVKKQVVKDEPTQPVKDFEPIRKKVTTQIEKKITPKIVEQVQVPRKLESLLAVEKTKSTPTMTKVKVEDIVEDKPKMVQEVAQVSRRQVTSVAARQDIPVLREKPILDSAPVVPQNKQTMEAKSVPQTETREEIEKEVNYAQTAATPTKVTKTTKQKVNYQTSQTAVSERNIQPTLTDVPTETFDAEAPQVAVTEAASRKSVASAVPTASTSIARTTSFDTPQTEMQQVKQTVAAATTTAVRSSDAVVEKEVEFEVAKATVGSVSTQKAVTYQAEATTKVAVREVSDVAPVEEFSPETQTAAVTNIATSARSTTHVQSALTGSVASNVKVNLSRDGDLPTSEQSKEFTQAKMTTDTGEAGDVEGKTIQTERVSDGAAKITEFAAKSSSRSDFRGIDSSATPSERKGAGMGEGGPQIMVNIPSGNMTNNQLFRLSGVIDGDIRGAFVTVNGSTQIAVVENGDLLADVALVKGINDISVLAFNSGGGVGKKDFQLLYTPPQGVPTIVLESPENGRQGAKAGDPVIVEGRIDDVWITQAKLLLNGVPIPMKVKGGRFRRKIFLPETRVTTFRVMATGRNGQTGYSSLHTVLIGYDIDIRNPRPY